MSVRVVPVAPPETKGDLKMYLDWLEGAWLPALQGKPAPKPVLTLIQGGRDG